MTICRQRVYFISLSFFASFQACLPLPHSRPSISVQRLFFKNVQNQLNTGQTFRTSTISCLLIRQKTAKKEILTYKPNIRFTLHYCLYQKQNIEGPVQAKKFSFGSSSRSQLFKYSSTLFEWQDVICVAKRKPRPCLDLRKQIFTWKVRRRLGGGGVMGWISLLSHRKVRVYKTYPSDNNLQRIE